MVSMISNATNKDSIKITYVRGSSQGSTNLKLIKSIEK